MPLMANTRSAAKQARVALRRRVINQRLVSKVRTLEKKIRSLVAQGDKASAAKLLGDLQSAVDKAAKKQTIHANKASRTKARVSKLLK